MSIYSYLSPSVAQEEAVSPFTESEKIEQFNKLVEVLNRLEPFKDTVRKFPGIFPTLAFYVEAMTFTYEKEWIVHLQFAIGKLEEFQRVFPDSSEAYRNSSILLNKLISNLYKTIITVRMLELQKDDPVKNKNAIGQCSVWIKGYELKETITQWKDKRNYIAAIINVADPFFPTWYKPIEEAEASTYQS